MPPNQVNYKLPPRPNSRQQPGSVQMPSKNISYDYNSNRLNSSREKSQDRLNTDRG